MKQLSLFLIGLLFAAISIAQSPQWKELPSPVKASLRGLSPVSAKVCWASGSGGTWLRTVDGGFTWDQGIVAGLDTVDFRSIHAFDQNTAVVASAGQPAVIYRTENAGKTWEKVHQEGPDSFFDGISFSGKKRGYVIGDPIDGQWMILETNDGGKTWKSLKTTPKAESGEAAFAASASSLIITKKGLFFGTGGRVSFLHSYQSKTNSWDKFPSPLIQREPSQGIFAVTQTHLGIIAVGGDYLKPQGKERNAAIFKENSWITPSLPPTGFRSGIAFWKRSALTIAVGPEGSDYSTDGGLSWKNFSSIGFHAVKISTDHKWIWASGSGGRLALLVL
jgi:photosystem II stability/assembly factor-like uncharacterized protein